MISPLAVAALLAAMPALTLAQAPVNSTNLVLFCSNRPAGLFCDPTTPNQKIECPSLKLVQCPETYGPEMCQERGVLKQFGFQGGIARCVPQVDQTRIEEFCAAKEEPGSYCLGDAQNNLRVLCPSGLLYKCVDNPFPNSRKCVQQTKTYATCRIKDNGGGGGASGGNCTSLAPITFTVTETVTKNVCLETSTQIIASVSTPDPNAQTNLMVSSSTEIAYSTSTFIEVAAQTSVMVATSTQVSYSTPPVWQTTSTLVVVNTPF